MRLLQSLAMTQNLTYDKKRMLTYGVYHGYSVSISYNGNLRRYAVSAYCMLPKDVTPQPFQEFGEALKKECKRRVQNTEAQDHRMTVFFIGNGGNSKKERETMMLVLDRLTGYLQQNQYIDSCTMCETETHIHWYDLNGQVYHMCDSCYQRMLDSLETNKQLQKNKRSNIFTGIIGALLGSLIGVVLWVIVGQMNYIVAAVGLVMAICTLKGYELFGGKINVPGIIICSVILIVMLFFANVADFAVYNYSYMSEYYGFTFLQNLQFFFLYFLEFPISDVPEFYSNLAIGYIFTIIAAVPTMLGQFRAKSGIYTAGRIDGTPTLGM